MNTKNPLSDILNFLSMPSLDFNIFEELISLLLPINNSKKMNIHILSEVLYVFSCIIHNYFSTFWY